MLLFLIKKFTVDPQTTQIWSVQVHFRFLKSTVFSHSQLQFPNCQIPNSYKNAVFNPRWVECPDVKLRCASFTVKVIGTVVRRAYNFSCKVGAPAFHIRGWKKVIGAFFTVRYSATVIPELFKGQLYLCSLFYCCLFPCSVEYVIWGSEA